VNAPPPTRPPLVVTLGGGGAYALGYCLGIADGLRARGIDISRSPLIGTSGGSHAAVAIATGMTYDQVAAIWQPYVETCGSFWVKATPLAEQLYGGRAMPEGNSAAGVAVRLLGFKRELLWAAEHPLPLIVAASSSPFPFVRPTKVGKRRYIDGGHRSNTSADIVPDAELNLVLAPFAFKSQGLVGRMAARKLAKEPGRWEARTGGRTMVVKPDPAMIAVEVRNMKAMGDTALGRQIYELAVPLGEQLADQLRAGHPDVVAGLGGDHVPEAI
jgi:NTE family protein